VLRMKEIGEMYTDKDVEYTPAVFPIETHNSL
jgi:hypothetical protein